MAVDETFLLSTDSINPIFTKLLPFYSSGAAVDAMYLREGKGEILISHFHANHRVMEHRFLMGLI